MAHPMSREFLGTCTIAIVLWYGGSLILSGDNTISAANFIYYLVIFYSIINPQKDLTKSGLCRSTGLASMQRVDKILSAENPIKSPANPVRINSLNDKIEYPGHIIQIQYRLGY